MNDAFRIGKKSFTWFVVGATILWAMSAAFLVLPLTAKAATLTAGDLIRGTEKSVYGGYPVYYYGTDGKKYLFPTSSTYFSWYSDFSAVKVITQAELEAVPFGGNVTYKPASKLVKFPGDAKVYAIDKGGVLRHLASEAVASALYGTEWYKPATLDSIPEGFQANYTTGSDVAAASDFSKTTVAASAPDIGTDKGLGATPVVSGALTAALAADNPTGSVLPGSSSSITVLKVNLTAGSAAVNLTGLTVKSTGVGSANDFTNLYVYEGANRLTSGRTLASQTKEATFSFAYSVPANTTKTLSVLVDVASIATSVATSGDTHAFSVTALGTTASVTGLPVTGNTMSIGSQSVSTVTVTKGADPANPTIGQTGVAIGEFKLTAGTNDVSFQRATVTVGGTVSVSDLANFTLYQGTTLLSAGTVSSDRVTFVLSSAYTIPQGSTRVFDIKADVGGRGSRTINTYIDSTYPSDLLVVDNVYGMGAGFTWTGFAAARTTCSTAGTPTNDGSCVTTQGGKVTVAFNGPSASDVSKGAQDAVLYKFSLTAGEQAVEFKKMGVTIAGTAGGFVRGSLGTKYFTDIKIKNLDTGAVVMGPKEHTAAASATTTGATPCANSTALCFTDAWTLDAGKTVNLAVTADLANAEDAGADEYYDEGYAVTMEAFSDTAVREVSTGQYVTASTGIVGYAANTGYTQTVRSSALTVGLASSPTSQSTVKGTQGVDMVGFSFAAGTSGAIKVTQLAFAGESDTNTTNFNDASGAAQLASNILSATLWDGSTQVGTAKSPSSSGTITFDNLDWNLAAGETKKLTVRVNLLTTLIDADTVDYVFLGLPVASVTAQDADSNTVSATAGTVDPANTNGASNYLTVRSTGTMTVALDGDTPLASLVVGGASGVNVAKFKFSSAYESYTVSKVRVAVDGASVCYAAPTTATTQAGTNGSCDDGISTLRVSYPKADGTTGTTVCSLSAGVADCQGMTFYVDVNKASSILTVQIDTGSISQSYVSGDAPVFGLDLDNNFKADGTSGSTLSACSDVTAGSGFTCASGTAYDGTNKTDVNANRFLLHKTKPTVTLAAGSPSGSDVPKTNQEALRFTVAADAASDLSVNVLYFKMSLSDQGATDWNINTNMLGNGTTTSKLQLYDRDDLTSALAGTWVFYTSAGATAGASDAAYAKVTLTTAKTVSAGTSKSFSLFIDSSSATRSSASVTGDKIQIEIPAVTDVGSGTLAVQGITWSELGNGAYSDATAGANIYGTLVKNLPVTGGTIVY